MTALRVALVKPEWGIRGGFELVVDRLLEHLGATGRTVHVLGFDAWRSDHRPFAMRVPDQSWARAPEFFTYMSQVESARRIQAERADVVVSTQPPSYAVEHRRHLSLFFHHPRMYYDLSPYVVRAGMVDPVAHPTAVAAVRKVDAIAFDGVRHFAAGSETVADRLVEFNGRVEGVSLFHAGPSVDIDDADLPPPTEPTIDALCVSRHDFPKRTELFVHAARVAPDLRMTSVGTGSRIGMLRQLDDRLRRNPDEPVDSTRLWLNTDPWVDPVTVDIPETNLHFAGAVADAELKLSYQQARCVVAPALLEDYGLTALEAMRYGKPMIVCTDGGHLTQLVQHGVNGLVVEPTGEAIAQAIRFLADNPERAKEMGACGREIAAAYTWTRALREFDGAIDAVMS